MSIADAGNYLQRLSRSKIHFTVPETNPISTKKPALILVQAQYLEMSDFGFLSCIFHNVFSICLNINSADLSTNTVEKSVSEMHFTE